MGPSNHLDAQMFIPPGQRAETASSAALAAARPDKVPTIRSPQGLGIRRGSMTLGVDAPR